MQSKVLCVFVFAVAVGACSIVARAQSVPDAIAYQGKLTNAAGVPVSDGTHMVVFRFYNAATGSGLLWTSSTVAVTTNGGLFTAYIQSVPTRVFDGDQVWLEVQADGQTVSPRVRFVSVPYAIRAGNSGSSEGWGLTGNAGTNPAQNFLGTTDQQPLVLKCDGSQVVKLETIYFGDTDYMTTTANVVAGHKQNEASPGVAGAAIGGGGYSVYDSATQQTTHYPNRVTDYFGTIGGGAGNLAGNNTGTTEDATYATVGGGQLNTASNTYSTVPGGYYNTAAGYSSFAAGNRAKAMNMGAFVWSDSSGGEFQSSSYNQFLVRAVGGVGILQSSPSGALTHALTVESGDPSTLRLIGPGAGYGYQATLNFGDGSHAYVQEDDDDRLTIYARLRTAITGGNVGIGATNPTEKLQIDSGNLLVRGPQNFAANTDALLMLGDGNNYVKALWGQGLRFGVYQGTDGMVLKNGGNVGIGTTDPQSRLHVVAPAGQTLAATFRGNVRILSAATSATVAEIGEGLDYAEGFDVSDPDTVRPGTVLVIDPANPGKLVVSTTAYDRKVAGIAAGANSLGSGVRLGAGQFDSDVALAGRVYCNVDATTASVEPGDLLTTSSRQGYAMKVTDHVRAQGAILGKAMQRLAKGEAGQILVLVTLQ